ncbi:hypothetical protein DSO57_1003661 [Entomophthora muscae]|uniref:Uncharacterized protein n=1 Tax=Entomophthora muscae TaxID=34485 RepID=A0ACC2T8B7_9FUNG|nr:hypothetical protein DSO57_1003661 [Entomophthora muscae]
MSISYGRPTFSGTARLPINRFSRKNSSSGRSASTNGHSMKKYSGDSNGFHPYSTVPKSRSESKTRFSKEYDLSSSPLLPSGNALVSEDSGTPLTAGEFSFTPDYNYFRYLGLAEHKGRKESLASSFSAPDFSSFKMTDLRNHIQVVRAVAWNKTGKYFATGSVDNTVAVWEFNTTGEIILHKELKEHSGSIDYLCWDPINTNRLATASCDKTVRVWDASSGALLHLISTPGENINICWSPDGKHLAVGNRAMTVSFIDVEKSQIVSEHSLSSSIYEITWSHSGAFFLLGTAQGNVVILDFPTLTHVVTLPAHTSSCFCLDMDPYGRFLATGGVDGKVSIWCLKTLLCLGTYTHLSASVNALRFSFDGQFLASGSEDAQISICLPQTGKVIHRINCDDVIHTLAWHPTRHILGYSSTLIQKFEKNSTTQNQVKLYGF